jgi:hypothetical protein
MARMTYDEAMDIFSKDYHVPRCLVDTVMLYRGIKAFNRAKRDGRVIFVNDKDEELEYEYALVHSSEISEKAMKAFDSSAFGIQFDPSLFKRFKRDCIFVFTDYLPNSLEDYVKYRELAAFHEAYELSLINERFNPNNFFSSAPHDMALRAELRKAEDFGDDFYQKYLLFYKINHPDIYKQMIELKTPEKTSNILLSPLTQLQR